MTNVFYLDQEGPAAASVGMHFPIPGGHKELEDHWKDRNQYKNIIYQELECLGENPRIKLNTYWGAGPGGPGL